MRIGEKILTVLSRDPTAPDYGPGDHPETEFDPEKSLTLLRRVFPDFAGLIRDKAVLDFGCGTGRQAAALALGGARHVTGLDTNERTLDKARALLDHLELGSRVSLASSLSPNQDRFDVIISQNAMEHFPQPGQVLDTMTGLLADEGRILISFGPPWFAPYGSHMHFFTRMPWVNVFFSEKTVMAVRSKFRDDGAIHYEQVESGLNRMTVARFERLVEASGLRDEFRRYDCVKGMDFLAKVPGVREFFVNHISVILKKGHR